MFHFHTVILLIISIVWVLGVQRVSVRSQQYPNHFLLNFHLPFSHFLLWHIRRIWRSWYPTWLYRLSVFVVLLLDSFIYPSENTIMFKRISQKCQLQTQKCMRNKMKCGTFSLFGGFLDFCAVRFTRNNEAFFLSDFIQLNWHFSFVLFSGWMVFHNSQSLSVQIDKGWQ